MLSPLLWLALFNDIQPQLRRLRRAEPEIFEGSSFQDLIYADDITSIFAHRDANRIAPIDCRNAALILFVLRCLELALSFPKSFNFVISPGLISGGALRRVPNPHRGSNMQRPMLDQQCSTALDDLPEDELIEAKISPPAFRSRLPSAWRNAIRIL